MRRINNFVNEPLIAIVHHRNEFYINVYGTLEITYIEDKDQIGLNLYRDIKNLLNDEVEQKEERSYECSQVEEVMEKKRLKEEEFTNKFISLYQELKGRLKKKVIKKYLHQITPKDIKLHHGLRGFIL